MLKMPVVFSGHGDPMIALRDDEVTRGMASTGKKIIDTYGKPKAILSISGHWYVKGTYVQSAPEPEQIYDMYGFPRQLYELKYPVKGDSVLTNRVKELLGSDVSVNDEWGIDHGTWTVLVHMFPDANIPVVQLSVDKNLSNEQCYEIGKKLSALREDGYLIFGSGNVVHNLQLVDWDNPNGTDKTVNFNEYVIEKIIAKDYDAVVNYKTIKDADYAVPTPEHYLPLLYCIGAAGEDDAEIFNNVCNLGSMAMTGFIFK